jgi:hypothetical protein
MPFPAMGRNKNFIEFAYLSSSLTTIAMVDANQEIYSSKNPAGD